MTDKIDALIFDFDGTILDTEWPDYLTWCEAYAEHNCELPMRLWVDAVGSNYFDPFAHLETQLGRAVDRVALRARRRERMSALCAELTLRPGVQEAIDDADALGLRLGVASSSGREWVEGYLQRLGLRHHFEAVFTREDVARVKPDPALYARTVNALGVSPAAAVAIEDSRNGLLAAKAAGLKCVVVPNEITQQLHFPEADLQMASLADRPLRAWLDELQQRDEMAR
jgi:HAD superfamily hydrolase (TIGR01509 family)